MSSAMDDPFWRRSATRMLNETRGEIMKFLDGEEPSRLELASEIEPRLRTIDDLIVIASLHRWKFAVKMTDTPGRIAIVLGGGENQTVDYFQMGFDESADAFTLTPVK